MKASDFHRAWEEAEMDIRLLEAEMARIGVGLAKVRSIHRDIYEGITGKPAPEFGAPVTIRRRAS